MRKWSFVLSVHAERDVMTSLGNWTVQREVSKSEGRTDRLLHSLTAAGHSQAVSPAGHRKVDVL